jgi:gentisate 1,2-dioxygenase
MSTGTRTDPTPFYERLQANHYAALWRIRGALTPEPVTAMVPYLWRYEETRALLMEAGGLITPEEASRRVLAFDNPGTAAHEIARATDTLWAALQLVLPGELAPEHRHTPAALRFVVEGDGGYTTVDDELYDMSPGDLILTPNWAWHGHGHTGGRPMIWLDGLDLPLLHSLRNVFADFPDGAARPPVPTSGPARVHAFPFATMRAALEERRSEDGDLYDDILIEYRHPETGGSIMPTLSAAMQLLRPGVATAGHRHTHSVVYHVVEGRGTSVVGSRRLDWSKGDTFVVPIWAAHRHLNSSAADALLFSFTDAPVVEALGLARTEPVVSPDLDLAL